jgi:hypothetical protein
MVYQVKRDIGRIEKWVLRNAFDDDERPYLPKVTKLYDFDLHSTISGCFSQLLCLFPVCSTFYTDRRSSSVMGLAIAGLMA